MCVFAWMNICVPCECLVPVETKQVSGPLEVEFRWLWVPGMNLVLHKGSKCC